MSLFRLYQASQSGISAAKQPHNRLCESVVCVGNNHNPPLSLCSTGILWFAWMIGPNCIIITIIITSLCSSLRSIRAPMNFGAAFAAEH